MRQIVQDPKQLSQLTDNIKGKGLSGEASAQSHRVIDIPPRDIEAQENVEE